MLTNLDIDFLSKGKLAAWFSVTLVLLSIVSIAVQNLEFGLDFTGGTVIELGFEEKINLNDLRGSLNDDFFSEAKLSHYGNSHTILLRLPPVSDFNKTNLAKKINQSLPSEYSKPQIKRIEYMGAQVGTELRDKSGVGMIVALLFMLIYVSMRFKFKFAVGALLALFHDVMITLGVFSLFRIPFDLTVLAAILAVIGYSLNDTIVISDRIRENFKSSRLDDAKAIIKKSLNETLARTVITSFTTMLVLLALLFVGGETLKGFAIALLVGVVVGTYSSIYVAANTLLLTKLSKDDFIVVKPEAIDDMP